MGQPLPDASLGVYGITVAAELVGSALPARLHTGELLDALSTGLILLDKQLCVVYANVGAQDLLGVSLRQARGLPMSNSLTPRL